MVLNTMNKFLKLSFLLLLTAASPLCVASSIQENDAPLQTNATHFATAWFSFDLPMVLKQTYKNEDSSISQNVYRTLPSTDYSPLQVRASVIKKAPTDPKDLPEWENNVLAAMTGIFTKTYHVTDDVKVKALNNKQKIKIGTETYQSVKISYENVDVSILVTVKNDMTYSFMLLSIESVPEVRKSNMDKLLNAMKTVRFKTP